MALPETGSVKREVFSPTVTKPLAQGRKGGVIVGDFFPIILGASPYSVKCFGPI